MQSIQLVALVTRHFEAEVPVLVRLMGTNIEFMPVDEDNPLDPANPENWEIMEKCTAYDLEETEQVVRALGGDPAVFTAHFPNCDDY